MVLLSFTNYDDNVITIPARCLPTPDRTHNMTRARDGPRAQTLPRLKSTSASGETPPRPSTALATYSTLIP
jgi:hypothetical protein